MLLGAAFIVWLICTGNSQKHPLAVLWDLLICNKYSGADLLSFSELYIRSNSAIFKWSGSSCILASLRSEFSLSVLAFCLPYCVKEGILCKCYLQMLLSHIKNLYFTIWQGFFVCVCVRARVIVQQLEIRKQDHFNSAWQSVPQSIGVRECLKANTKKRGEGSTHSFTTLPFSSRAR